MSRAAATRRVRPLERRWPAAALTTAARTRGGTGTSESDRTSAWWSLRYPAAFAWHTAQPREVRLELGGLGRPERCAQVLGGQELEAVVLDHETASSRAMRSLRRIRARDTNVRVAFSVLPIARPISADE